MNKIIVFFAILTCGICVQAQPADANGAAKNADGQKSKTLFGNDEKLNLPPEKLDPVKIPRFETAPLIDGKLDEEIWKQAAEFKDFYQTTPGDNIAPSKPTVAYMGYDKEHLYIAFHLERTFPIAQIWQRL